MNIHRIWYWLLSQPDKTNMTIAELVVINVIADARTNPALVPLLHEKMITAAMNRIASELNFIGNLFPFSFFMLLPSENGG